MCSVYSTYSNIKYESWGWSTDPPCSWARKQFLGSYGWEKQSGKEKSTNIMVFSLITNYAFLAAQLIVSFFSTTVFVTQLCFKILFLHSKPSWLSGSLHCDKIYLRIKTEPVTVGAWRYISGFWLQIFCPKTRHMPLHLLQSCKTLFLCGDSEFFGDSVSLNDYILKKVCHCFSKSFVSLSH